LVAAQFSLKDRSGMTKWSPTLNELEMISEMGNARLPVWRIAEVLGIDEVASAKDREDFE
jgi:hypothetical protein